jgi:hypothetical protein
VQRERIQKDETAEPCNEKKLENRVKAFYTTKRKFKNGGQGAIYILNLEKQWTSARCTRSGDPFEMDRLAVKTVS